MNGLLTVTPSPHIRSPRTTRSIMRDVLIALIPVVIVAVVYFGWRALLLICVSGAVSCLCEFVWEKAFKKDITISDLSSVVTGVILALNMPAGMPVWELIFGDICAVIVVKMLFGGLGRNFVNPALAGRIILFVSFTADMTNYTVPSFAPDALSSATPLALEGSLTWADFPSLLLGLHGGVIGEVCSLAIIAGCVYLCVRGVIKPIIPACFVGAELLFSWLFGAANPVLGVFSGGLLFGAVFMATDYVTSPLTNWGKVIFGVGCGFLTAAMRAFAGSNGAVSFAILIMNLLVPYINDITRRKAFGGVKAK